MKHIDISEGDEILKEHKADERNRKVWYDSDDENIKIDISKVPKYRKLRKSEDDKVLDGIKYMDRLKEFYNNRVMKAKGNNWVSKARKRAIPTEEISTSDSSEDSDSDKVQKLGQRNIAKVYSNKSSVGIIERFIERNGLSRTHTSIPSTNIDIRRLPNANIQSPSNCVIRSLEFHQGGNYNSNENAETLLSVSGWDKTVKLFQIDGIDNPMLTSLHFENFPIYESKFSTNGDEMLILGPNKRIGIYNMIRGSIDFLPGIAGRSDKRYWNLTIQNIKNTDPLFALSTYNGNILLLNQRNKQLVRVFKLNGVVTSLSFHPCDSNILISSNNQGELYLWDINTGRCKQRLIDYGSLSITNLSTSNSLIDQSNLNSYILTGSKSGYVNIYDAFPDKSLDVPKYSIDNFTTSISSIAVHPSNEIAAISSKWCKDSLKIIHLSTGTVYKNWPTTRTPLKYVSALDFSKYSGYLAIGNDKGEVLLYQVCHYI
ncbi:uncharacterized protein CMU_037850 [Cryptosporidium muris RN66]|uniref:Uncharacterized protein n=1 Tax=Cryptosporidium muris (strain RN66) TaxID=441375 RepID=B6A929_CRYMR|nr:uncharacterized protein CMU_037850 [Cryptosporidium muris RN66]EEA04720.1 hypothetical protein, conserved [Cryptosporidium muris RN66]|eukprot:XP_002139069.1 hypothetical protein [Cryptosporidium muris RN66]